MKHSESGQRLRIVLLAYPDNPAGKVMFEALHRKRVPIHAVVIERKTGKSNWKRLRAKIRKDGFKTAILRSLEMFWLKINRDRIVDLAARENVHIQDVERFNGKDCEELLSSMGPDLLVIASAPILKKEIFEKAKIGCLNAHPGWLPAYRGLGANAYALQQGDFPGVTVHFIDSGVDTGPILVRERLELRAKDTVARINDRAVERGAELMADTILRIMAGEKMKPVPFENPGPNYRSMDFREVKKVNRIIRSRGKDAV